MNNQTDNFEFKKPTFLKLVSEINPAEIPNKSGIYGYYNLKTKKYYIGQSRNLRNRFKQHLNKETANKFETELINNMDSFSYAILELTDLRLDYLEWRYINRYNSYRNGYNLKRGNKKNACRQIADEKLLIENRELDKLITKKLTKEWREPLKKELRNSFEYKRLGISERYLDYKKQKIEQYIKKQEAAIERAKYVCYELGF